MKLTKTDQAVKNVCKNWREYGTPTKSQCEKIAYDTIIEYEKLLILKTS